MPTKVSDHSREPPTKVSDRFRESPTIVRHQFRESPTKVRHQFRESPTKLSDRFRESPTKVSDHYRDPPTKLSDHSRESPAKVSDLPTKVRHHSRESPTKVRHHFRESPVNWHTEQHWKTSKSTPPPPTGNWVESNPKQFPLDSPATRRHRYRESLTKRGAWLGAGSLHFGTTLGSPRLHVAGNWLAPHQLAGTIIVKISKSVHHQLADPVPRSWLGVRAAPLRQG